MTLAERIESFTELGQIIRDSLGEKREIRGAAGKTYSKPAIPERLVHPAECGICTQNCR